MRRFLEFFAVTIDNAQITVASQASWNNNAITSRAGQFAVIMTTAAAFTTSSTIGLGTGGIDFVLSPVWQEQGPKDLVEKAKAVWPDIEKAKADIISGSLKPPFNTQL